MVALALVRLRVGLGGILVVCICMKSELLVEDCSHAYSVAAGWRDMVGKNATGQHKWVTELRATESSAFAHKRGRTAHHQGCLLSFQTDAHALLHVIVAAVAKGTGMAAAAVTCRHRLHSLTVRRPARKVALLSAL